MTVLAERLNIRVGKPFKANIQIDPIVSRMHFPDWFDQMRTQWASLVLVFLVFRGT